MGADPATDAVFREVYNATFDDVRRFCLRRLPASDVNDAVSEVYLVAWQKVDKIPRGSEALPWLLGVARNVVRHVGRSNRRRLRLTVKAMSEPTRTGSDPETQLIRRAEDDELAVAISSLSGTDQEVILLRAWEDLSAPTIATVLGCSVSAAEKRVTRAFKRLEQAIKASDRITNPSRSMTKRGRP